MYFVFKRSDGYVGAINASTPQAGRTRLAPYPGSGHSVSFRILLETESWDEAHALIVIERAKV
jgi:hypothetical protein